jgi:hypothetical protein
MRDITKLNDDEPSLERPKPCSILARTFSKSNGLFSSVLTVSRTAIQACPTRFSPSVMSALWLSRPMANPANAARALPGSHVKSATKKRVPASLARAATGAGGATTGGLSWKVRPEKNRTERA